MHLCFPQNETGGLYTELIQLGFQNITSTLLAHVASLCLYNIDTIYNQSINLQSLFVSGNKNNNPYYTEGLINLLLYELLAHQLGLLKHCVRRIFD